MSEQPQCANNMGDKKRANESSLDPEDEQQSHSRVKYEKNYNRGTSPDLGMIRLSTDASHSNTHERGGNYGEMIPKDLLEVENSLWNIQGSTESYGSNSGGEENGPSEESEHLDKVAADINDMKTPGKRPRDKEKEVYVEGSKSWPNSVRMDNEERITHRFPIMKQGDPGWDSRTSPVLNIALRPPTTLFDFEDSEISPKNASNSEFKVRRISRALIKQTILRPLFKSERYMNTFKGACTKYFKFLDECGFQKNIEQDFEAYRDWMLDKNNKFDFKDVGTIQFFYPEYQEIEKIVKQPDFHYITALLEFPPSICFDTFKLDARLGELEISPPRLHHGGLSLILPQWFSRTEGFRSERIEEIKRSAHFQNLNERYRDWLCSYFDEPKNLLIKFTLRVTSYDFQTYAPIIGKLQLSPSREWFEAGKQWEQGAEIY